MKIVVDNQLPILDIYDVSECFGHGIDVHAYMDNDITYISQELKELVDPGIIGYYSDGDAKCPMPSNTMALLFELKDKIKGWWDRVYPEDIFDGSSGDEGACFVGEIRELIRKIEVDGLNKPCK